MLLAFAGKQRSGKDTAASYLIDKYPGEIYKFASPLYEIQKAIYDICDLYHNENTKDRFLLQWIGTDWGRNTIDKDLWVNILEKRLKKNIREYPDDNLYVTDCRFPQEVEMLEKLGFYIINITRNEDLRVAAGATNLTHISETGLDGYFGDLKDLTDFKNGPPLFKMSDDGWAIIWNNYTLDKFYEALDEVIVIETSQQKSS